MVQGRVELGTGRLSDQVNEVDVLTFYDATLCALDDGHEVALPEVEVERRELHVIEVDGHRGDPVRRKRTVEERVLLEVGPFVIEGNLHRPPNALPLASLTRWATFVPVTEARIGFREGDAEPLIREVVLVNRERIDKTEPLAAIPIYTSDPVAPTPFPPPATPAG
jgi:hypothetical protein